jgi:hypothetical protein
MPVQVYECKAGHVTESYVSFVDDVPKVTTCSTCGKAAVWSPSVPYKMLLTRAVNRKHNYPDDYEATQRRHR